MSNTMNEIIINLTDVVQGTTLANNGHAFYIELEKAMLQYNKVKISMKGITSLSSSFLNTSIGELIDKFGINKIRGKIVFVNCQKGTAERIKDYVARYTFIEHNS